VVLVADEAVSALDVSVQPHILALLAELREEMNLAMLFITHDLRVAAEIADRIVVMRHGEIVEQGETQSVFRSPRHAYTSAARRHSRPQPVRRSRRRRFGQRHDRLIQRRLTFFLRARQRHHNELGETTVNKGSHAGKALFVASLSCYDFLPGTSAGSGSDPT
jgi:ABC-type glutathione transport system ATPase component